MLLVAVLVREDVEMVAHGDHHHLRHQLESQFGSRCSPNPLLLLRAFVAVGMRVHWAVEKVLSTGETADVEQVAVGAALMVPQVVVYLL